MLRKISIGIFTLLTFVVFSTLDFTPVYAITPTTTVPPAMTAQPLKNYATKINNFGDIINTGKAVLFSFVGLAVVAYIAYAGYTWLTSLGEPEKIKKAQSMVIYGFIGLIIIAFSFIIIQLVSKIIGVNIEYFTGSVPCGNSSMCDPNVTPT